MKVTLNILLALLVISLVSVGVLRAFADGEPLPDTIYAWGKHLQFVSLERAVDTAGNIDTQLLRSSTADHLRRNLRAPKGTDGCVDGSAVMSTDIPSHGFEDIHTSLYSADHVLVGRVTGLRPGYYNRLGHLVGIETEEILFGSPHSRFYLFFPKGDFEFQGTKYCVSHDAYPDLPAVGDRILLALRNQLHGLLLDVHSTQLVVMPDGEKPSPGKSVAVSGAGTPKMQLDLESAEEVIVWAKRTLQEVGRK